MLDAIGTIMRKKRGESLPADEIRLFIDGFLSGGVPDYQMSAFLMAVCFAGMSAEETAALTMVMAESGQMLDLSPLIETGLPVVDKHSTGGVGDKVTLIAAPIAAACGVLAPKMSGRGLGFTGGTIDKLESIPGLRTDMPFPDFLENVRQNGFAVAAQSGNLTPADKAIYALRDATGTVDSIPLIASSIMSKKIATGAPCILLDVKTGSGAFMKTVGDARKLAQTMTDIGLNAGRRVKTMITAMDKPLGLAVGNALEVKEAVQLLGGPAAAELQVAGISRRAGESHGQSALYEVCLETAAQMLLLGGLGGGSLSVCHDLAASAVTSGAALERLLRMVKAQGGDPDCIRNPDLLPRSAQQIPLTAKRDGFIQEMNCELVGHSAQLLGAGRAVKSAPVDPEAGIVFLRHTGDPVRAGETIAVLHAGRHGNPKAALDLLSSDSAIRIGDSVPKSFPTILK